jgi:predicted TIM-barrel fold metal-dependent hydrolase
VNETHLSGKDALDMRIIDIDSHFYEPMDWLTVRRPDLAAELPPPGRFMDQIRTMHSLGVRALPESDRPDDPLDLMTKEFRKHTEKMDLLQPETLDLSSEDPYYMASGRLRMLDEIGVDIQFLNPTFGMDVFFSSLAAGKKELIPQLQAAWNDFAADQVYGHTDRLMPVCQVYTDDIEWTVKEMHRMRALGSRAFHISQHPTKSLTHPDYEPMWSAAEDLGMVAYVHVMFGRSVPHPSWVNNGRGVAAFQESVVPSDPRAETRNLINAMVFDGVFERHPKLYLVLAESGTAWMPWFVHELDHRLTKLAMDGLPQDNFYRLPLKPSEYIARQVKVSPLIGFTETGFEHLSIVEVLEQLPGDDMLVYSSDFPHVEGRRDAVTAFDKYLPDDVKVRDRFYGGTMADVLAV